MMFWATGPPRVARMHSVTASPPATEIAPTELHRGECLCGEIAFEFRESHQYGRGRAMGMCHCTRCRRWSGGAGVPFVVASPEHFRVTKGQELIARYRGARAAVRAFCRRCGSSLYTDAGMTYYVSAGVLLDLRLTPAFHTQIADRPAWDEIADDAPRIADMPTVC